MKMLRFIVFLFLFVPGVVFGSDVLNRATKDYRTSVNTPDFPPSLWIINPDLSVVQGFPSRYWIITGDSVALMNQAARDAIDAQIESNSKDAEATGLLNAAIAELLSEINKDRAAPDRTSDAAFESAVRARLEN